MTASGSAWPVLSIECSAISHQASVGSASVAGNAGVGQPIEALCIGTMPQFVRARCTVSACRDFRRLHVWQRAHAFVLDARRAVRAFPPTGYADLRSQVTRAAESIAHDIVEGCASASRKEFAHHLNVSIKSTSEVDYQLQLARDYGILPYDVWRLLAREVVEIRKMLTALRRTVLQTADTRAPRAGEPMAPDLAMPEETEPDA